MKKFTLLKILALTLLIPVFTISSSAQSSDSSVSQGGNSLRNGLTTSIGPSVEVGEEPELYWSGGEAAAVAGYPVIEGENLIVYRRLPSNSQEESWIINYNVYTGEERWRTQLPVDTYHNYSKVSAVGNGHVYANRAGGASEPEFIYALDIDSGNVVWTSTATIGEHESESIAFADNGDIIAADMNHIVRINYLDGTTIWDVPRGGSSSDGNSPNVYGDRVYIWDQNSSGMYINTFDINTGAELYASEIIGTPGFQQQSFMIGTDGIIYADLLRGNSNDAVYAIEDDGTQLTTLWSYPIGYSFTGNFSVGADGSVYVLSVNEEIVRLDPTTGSVLNTSPVVGVGGNFMTTYMATGDDGMVYLIVNDYPYSKLHFFNAELDLLWGEEINGLKGIALGEDVLVVNGKNSIINAYIGSESVGVSEEIDSNEFNVYPNPSEGIFNITNNFSNEKDVYFDVLNSIGQVVYSSEIENSNSTFNISNQDKGVYVIRFFVDNNYHHKKIVKE